MSRTSVLSATRRREKEGAMPVWTFTSGPNKVRRALGARLLLKPLT